MDRSHVVIMAGRAAIGGPLGIVAIYALRALNCQKVASESMRILGGGINGRIRGRVDSMAGRAIAQLKLR